MNAKRRRKLEQIMGALDLLRGELEKCKNEEVAENGSKGNVPMHIDNMQISIASIETAIEEIERTLTL